jgi:hypothetical protein
VLHRWLAWKLGSELLFPLTGDYVWEFVERAGSYGAPLGLLLAGRAAMRLGARPAVEPPGRQVDDYVFRFAQQDGAS